MKAAGLVWREWKGQSVGQVVLSGGHRDPLDVIWPRSVVMLGIIFLKIEGDSVKVRLLQRVRVVVAPGLRQWLRPGQEGLLSHTQVRAGCL